MSHCRYFQWQQYWLHEVYQAIIRTLDSSLLTSPLGMDFSVFWIETQHFSYKQSNNKIPSAQWQTFSSLSKVLEVLIHLRQKQYINWNEHTMPRVFVQLIPQGSSCVDLLDVITVKPVCNDHLYYKIYYLWFIQ